MSENTRLVNNGAWCYVKLVDDEGESRIALCKDISFSEDLQVQPIDVLNMHEPVEIDSNGYSCNLNMNCFVPEDKPSGSEYPDGSNTNAYEKLAPDVVKLWETHTAKKFNALEIHSSKKEVRDGDGLLFAFAGVMVSKMDVSITKAPTTASVSLVAIKRTK